MSLRVRLTLWNVGALSLTVVLLGVLLREVITRQALAQMDQELIRRGAFVQENFRAGSPPTLPPAGFDGLPFLQIYDQTGHSRVQNTPAPDRETITQVLRSNTPQFSQNQEQRLYTVPLIRTFAFQTGLPLARVEQQRRAATQALVTLLPFALVVVAGLSFILTDRALRPLETAFERQKRFTADASHELRTPLSIVRAAAELGRAHATADTETRSLFSQIERTVDRMNGLVENLLLLARSDSGKLPLQREPLSLPAFLEERIAEVGLLFPQGATVVVEACPPVFTADPLLLTQLLQNVLGNALRHTPPNGTITLTATENTLTLRDSGPGIAPEHLPHLTERFYRVDSARARKGGGAGLGLAICQGIAHAHGGTLTITSVQGQGTTVEIFLPQP